MNQITHFRALDPIENLFRNFFVRPVDFNHLDDQQNDWLMKVDIAEKTDEFVVNAELPGADKENINVDIEGNVFKIEAENKFEHQEKNGKLLRQERYYGKSSRSFQLPQDVDEQKAQARFANGVLSLILPKKENTKAKKLEIQ